MVSLEEWLPGKGRKTVKALRWEGAWQTQETKRRSEWLKVAGRWGQDRKQREEHTGSCGHGEGLGFTPKHSGQLLKTSLPLPVSSFWWVFGSLLLTHSVSWLSNHFSVADSWVLTPSWIPFFPPQLPCKIIYWGPCRLNVGNWLYLSFFLLLYIPPWSTAALHRLLIILDQKCWCLLDFPLYLVIRLFWRIWQYGNFHSSRDTYQ